MKDERRGKNQKNREKEREKDRKKECVRRQGTLKAKRQKGGVRGDKR